MLIHMDTCFAENRCVYDLETGSCYRSFLEGSDVKHIVDNAEYLALKESGYSRWYCIKGNEFSPVIGINADGEMAVLLPVKKGEMNVQDLVSGIQGR